MSIPYTSSEALVWLVNFMWPSTRQHYEGSWAHAAGGLESKPAGGVKLVFVGDLAPSGVSTASNELRDVFESADLIVANCETTVFDRGRVLLKSFLQFNVAPQVFIERLERLGISFQRLVISVANNHAMDFGPDGLLHTVNALEAHGMRTVGWKNRHESVSSRRVIVDRLLLEIHAWTEWTNEPAEGEPSIATNPPSAGAATTEGVIHIGYPHWGYEFQHFPRTEEVLRGRRYLDGGFDLVVGHHPHVAQPIERFDSKLCCYSLGNLASPAFAWATHVFPLLEVWLRKPLEGERPLAGYRLSFWTDYSGRADRAIVPITQGDSRIRVKWNRLAKRLYGEGSGSGPLVR